MRIASLTEYAISYMEQFGELDKLIVVRCANWKFWCKINPCYAIKD
jgi:hypothetical protein